jgi:hypothetical protein
VSSQNQITGLAVCNLVFDVILSAAKDIRRRTLTPGSGVYLTPTIPNPSFTNEFILALHAPSEVGNAPAKFSAA